MAGEGTRETGSLDDEGRCSRLSLINDQINFRECGSRLRFRVPSPAKYLDLGGTTFVKQKRLDRKIEALKRCGRGD